MIELASLPPTVTALAVVGAILLQAVVLYVGYGIVERVTAPIVSNALENSR